MKEDGPQRGMRGLLQRPLGALLALAGAARCDELRDFAAGCSVGPPAAAGSRCDFSDSFACCPAAPPYGTWRRRQAVEPLLLKRVLSLHPLLPSEGISAASPPPLVGRTAYRLTAGLTVLRLFGIDERTQHFSMHYRLRLMWRDCRLLHNCSWMEMSGEHPLYRQLWTPPWAIEERESDDGDMHSDLASISPDGAVSLSVERVGAFRCSFDFTDMPFDRQSCNLTLFVPPMADGTPPDLVPMLGPDGEAAVLENTANAEWEIDAPSRWSVERLQVVREQRNRRRPATVLRWSFSLKRKPHSMITKFVFPTVLYYLVSWLGLWIDPTAVPARAAIGVIPVLIMTTKLNTLTNVIPPISYSVKLENFIVATLTFIVLQMLEFGFVNYGLRRRRLRKAMEEDPLRVAETGASHSRQILPIGVRGEEGDKLSQRSLTRRSIEAPDWIAVVCSDHVDSHFRWISILAYTLTSAAILLH